MRNQKDIDALRLMGIIGPTHTTNIYEADATKQHYASATVYYFLGLGDIESVWDLGCGTGVYIQAFLDAGVQADGIEINCEILPELKTDIQRIGFYDLAQPLPTSYKPRDLVFTTEVAEHILPSGVRSYIDNITRLATKWIVLTSSDKTHSPGHVNPQPLSYWIDAIQQCGYHEYDDSISQKARRFFSGLIPGRSLAWFKNSLLVFRAITENDNR